MFEQKKKSLFENKKTSGSDSKTENAFLNYSHAKSAETLSGNGAKKYSKTANEFVNQFGRVGEYKAPRVYSKIVPDCELLWSIDPLKAVQFIGYLRIVPRQIQLFDGSKTSVSQKGAELKHESIMRLFWLHQKDKKVFFANLPLFVAMGSFKDVITMLQYDLVYHDWNGRVLDWKQMGDFILSALNNSNTRELMKKYLPQIKANSVCTTVESQADNKIAKWICSLIFGTKESPTQYKQYRLLKSSGTAHQWQQLISQRKFDLIDFNQIHGRALNLLVRSKFLKNQGLSEKYESWITKDDVQTVKYTGFVHELFERVSYNTDKIQAETINKQFYELVNKAKEKEMPTKFLVVRDTSGSMSSNAIGTKMSSGNIAKAIALYFSEFLSGVFANSWMEFADKAELRKWVGKTSVEKWNNDRSNYYGGTDFQSVINWFCDAKKTVPESDFPTGIVCISDGEFNVSELKETNVETAKKKLIKAGFSKEYCDNFVIVLWNIPNTFYRSGTKFETFNETKNCFYFSGYSASVFSFLQSGNVETDVDLVNAALDQEILQMIEVD